MKYHKDMELIDLKNNIWFKMGVKRLIQKGIPIAVAAALTVSSATACNRRLDSNSGGEIVYGQVDLEMMYGIPAPFADVDYSEVFNGGGSKYYNQLTNQEWPNIEPKGTYSFYESMIGDGRRRENVAITFSPADAGVRWVHTIVSTSDDLLVYSVDKTLNETYLTGFCDGEFYNETGMISRDLENQIAEEISTNGYHTVLSSLRKDLAGFLCKMENDGFINLSKENATVYDYDGNEVAYTSVLTRVEDDFLSQVNRFCGIENEG